jgi:hypothetical protein
VNQLGEHFIAAGHIQRVDQLAEQSKEITAAHILQVKYQMMAVSFFVFIANIIEIDLKN